ncbi:MAG: hypothetical protein VW455_09740 [Nitrospinota bacterium]
MKIDTPYGKEIFRVNPLPQKRRRQGKSFQEQLEDSLNTKKEEVQKQIKKSLLDILV